MASDLSTLIQEGICNTLNGLLAKDATLKETTKAVAEDMPSINLLKVESSFEFDNITSTWAFFIPAYTASYIFNSMLGDDSEPVLEIDDDIADAMSEFVSNLSGGLTTSINGQNFDDLGQSKFVISGSEKISSEKIDNFDNMYKFSIDLAGKNIFIFIQYDELILPFLSILSNSKESVHEESLADEIENLDIEGLSSEPDEEELLEVETQEEPSLEVEEKEEEPEEPKEEPEEKEESEDDIEIPKEDEKTAKKNKIIKIVVIAVAALLLLTIIAGVVMYFMGIFDEPEIKQVDTNKTKTVKTKDNVDIVQYEEKQGINFKITDINKRRLNAKLEALTKYEVLNEEELQAQKAAEKERLYQLEKEQELLEFAAKNKEEDIFTKKEKDEERIIDIKTKFSDSDIKAPYEEELQNENNQKIEQELVRAEPKTPTQEQPKTAVDTPNEKEDEKNIQDDGKMKFVLVHSLKYRLYNQLITQVTTQDARISICNNSNGRTAVYIGPFKNSDDQLKMVDLIEKQNIKDAVISNLTKEEFDSRCSFE